MWGSFLRAHWCKQNYYSRGSGIHDPGPGGGPCHQFKEAPFFGCLEPWLNTSHRTRDVRTVQSGFLEQKRAGTVGAPQRCEGGELGLSLHSPDRLWQRRTQAWTLRALPP